MKSPLIFIFALSAIKFAAALSLRRGMANDECDDFFSTLWDAFLYNQPVETFENPQEFIPALSGIVSFGCQKVRSPKCDALRQVAAAKSDVLLYAIYSDDLETFSANYEKLWVELQGYLLKCVQL